MAQATNMNDSSAPATSLDDFSAPRGEMRIPIDLDKVGRYVAEFAPFLPSANLRAHQFGTGTSNPTYLVWSASNSATKFVLRRQPPGELLAGAHNLDREYRTLKFLEDTPVPTAKMYSYSNDASVCGAPFYLMEAVPGRVLDDGGESLSPQERVKLWDSACTAVAALHDVDWRGLPNFGRPGAYGTRLVKTWQKQFDGAESTVCAKLHRPCLSLEMRSVSEWILKNATSQGEFVDDKNGHEPSSMVHGDLGLHNFIVHPTEPKINAVIDWELATIGHPVIDMNYMAGNLVDGWRSTLGNMALPDPSNLEGTPMEWEFAQNYFKKRNMACVSKEEWHYASCVNLFRSAAISQGVLARGLQGNASSGGAKNEIFEQSYIACVKGALNACGLREARL